MNGKSITIAGCCLAMSLMATGAHAYNAGDWVVKGRIANVDPDDSSGEVILNGAAVAGSGVSVDDAPTLDISISYVFDPNWAVELLLDITSEHDINATGTLSNLGKIADARALPPALLLQYHFLPNSAWRPYVGAGINYTNFISEDTTESIDGVLGGSTDISLDDSFGLTLQAGIDIDLAANWFLTLDLKWIDLDTDATITGPGGTITVDVDIDPLVYGIGVGTSF